MLGMFSIGFPLLVAGLLAAWALVECGPYAGGRWALGDPPPALVELGELGVPEVLVELPLRELDAAARLGDHRQVGEDRQLV